MNNNHFSADNQPFNEAKASSINPLTSSKISEPFFKLDIDFCEFGKTNEVDEVKLRDNQSKLDLFISLSKKGFRFMVQPRNNRKTDEAYLWIIATKQGEDREEFSLYVNDEILNVVVPTLRGKTVDISEINVNDLGDFNSRITNLEYVMFINEKAQGRIMKKTYTTNGQIYSSPYKRGMIIYKPYLNPELKAYVNA